MTGLGLTLVATALGVVQLDRLPMGPTWLAVAAAICYWIVASTTLGTYFSAGRIYAYDDKTITHLPNEAATCGYADLGMAVHLDAGFGLIVACVVLSMSQAGLYRAAVRKARAPGGYEALVDVDQTDNPVIGSLRSRLARGVISRSEFNRIVDTLGLGCSDDPVVQALQAKLSAGLIPRAEYDSMVGTLRDDIPRVNSALN
jgi:PHD/YefM family antitoxin component YafN of YafNO toxin-antitoxin module